MTKFFYMLMRKKKVPTRIAIRNTKPRFIRARSGELNFHFSDVSNQNFEEIQRKLFKKEYFKNKLLIEFSIFIEADCWRTKWIFRSVDFHFRHFSTEIASRFKMCWNYWSMKVDTGRQMIRIDESSITG